MSILRSAFVLAVFGGSLGLTTVVRADDLAGTVATKLRESGTLAGYRVNVKAKSGTVWLEGRVADEKQLSAAVSLAETTPGVERVVNRLSVGAKPDLRPEAKPLGVPASVRASLGQAAGGAGKPDAAARAAAANPTRDVKAAPRGLLGFGGQASAVQLTQAINAAEASQPAAAGRPAATPRPLAMALVGAAQPAGGQIRDPRAAMRGAVQRTAMRGGMAADPMHLPAPGVMDGQIPGGVADGQMVPGSLRIIDGGAAGGAYSDGGPLPGGNVSGGPLPMGGTGVGMPPIPGRGNGPNMPNYAWPSYSAYPNAAAVQYPTQYSPTAWPYIGPFYPYPQVPLGWRRVSLEWDDGWWWLDFDERHVHSHHR